MRGIAERVRVLAQRVCGLAKRICVVEKQICGLAKRVRVIEKRLCGTAQGVCVLAEGICVFAQGASKSAQGTLCRRAIAKRVRAIRFRAFFAFACLLLNNPRGGGFWISCQKCNRKGRFWLWNLRSGFERLVFF